jgi:hypothetical protein
MFDPTVFENVKVACENQIYDLDNLTGEIEVTNRIDRMDLSTMSREFALQFRLTDQKDVNAEIRLNATLKDLADEILEVPGASLGCTLSLHFHKKIVNVSKECKQIDEILNDIWKDDIVLSQILSFDYKQEVTLFTNTINLVFNRKINEDHIGDLPELIDHILMSLSELNSC